MIRFLDILGAICLLAILAIPMAIIALILRFTNEREILFRQVRIGQNGKEFLITKFVSMRKDSPSIGSKDITLPNDPRIFGFGRFLRKTKLNELPQLFDVLRGDLSLVGWRPLMPQGFSAYPADVQKRVIEVKPGVTGIGSLVFRNEEALIEHAGKIGKGIPELYEDDILPYKGALEIWYVENASLITNMKILGATIIAVFFPGWRGYAKWFRGLPKPESELIASVLKIDR